MPLIVNVDDLGLHPAVRRAVQELGAMDAVSSASLLATGTDLEAACQVTGVGLGVHLNALRGKPLSDPAEIPSLVGSDGLLVGRYAELFRRYARRRLRLDDVEREWRRQIEAILALGVKPTHFDSEKHIHCWPRLMPIAQKLARCYNVRWLRRTRERLAWTRWSPGALRARLLNAWCLWHRAAPEVHWPDWAWAIADPLDDTAPQRLRTVLAALPPTATVEVVCHPGRPEPGDQALAASLGPMRVAQSWQREFDTLSSAAWREVVAEPQVRLVHYGQLESGDGSGQGG